MWVDVVGLRSSRSDRAIILVLQAYIDESYEPDGVFVLGGYVSTAERWSRFASDWEKCLPKFGVLDSKSNQYHFKYNQMAALQERRERIPIFENIVMDHALFGLFCRIHIQDIQRAIGRIQIPAHKFVDFAEWEHPYYVAYRCLMDMFHFNRDRFPDLVPEGEPIDFIFDDQLFEKKIIIETWRDYIEEKPDSVRHLYGRMPAFRDDKQFLPLQAADLIAGKVRENFTKDTFYEVFEKGPSDKVAFPILGVEFNEDQLVASFKDLARAFTDAQIFDVKYGDVLI